MLKRSPTIHHDKYKMGYVCLTKRTIPLAIQYSSFPPLTQISRVTVRGKQKNTRTMQLKLFHNPYKAQHSHQEHELQSQTAWVKFWLHHLLAVLLQLAKFIYFSSLCLRLLICKRGIIGSYLIGLLWDLNKLMYVLCLEQWLVHKKHQFTAAVATATRNPTRISTQVPQTGKLTE